MRRFFFLLPALMLPRLATAIELAEYVINEATTLVQGTSSATSYLNGIASLKPDEQADLIKRSATILPPARAVVLYQLATIKNGPAAVALTALLNQPDALTGKYKIPRNFDPFRWREMAFEGHLRERPDLQTFASSLVLAHWGVPKTSGALAQQVQMFRKPWIDALTSSTEKQEAVIAIALLHLNKIHSADSQQTLEQALRFQEDPTVRVLSASFAGITGETRSVRALLDAVRVETESGIQKRISLTLSSHGNYTEKMRVAMVPELLRISEDTRLPVPNRQWADYTLLGLTKRDRIQGQRAWVAEKEKALDFKVEGNEFDGTAQGPAAPAAAEPQAPGAGAAEAKPAAGPNRESECAMWLLLAKNFLNNKNYDKAEEQVKRILEAAPNSRAATDAREVQKKIDAGRKGATE